VVNILKSHGGTISQHLLMHQMFKENILTRITRRISRRASRSRRSHDPNYVRAQVTSGGVQPLKGTKDKEEKKKISAERGRKDRNPEGGSAAHQGSRGIAPRTEGEEPAPIAEAPEFIGSDSEGRTRCRSVKIDDKGVSAS